MKCSVLAWNRLLKNSRATGTAGCWRNRLFLRWGAKKNLDFRWGGLSRVEDYSAFHRDPHPWSRAFLMQAGEAWNRCAENSLALASLKYWEVKFDMNRGRKTPHLLPIIVSRAVYLFSIARLLSRLMNQLHWWVSRHVTVKSDAPSCLPREHMLPPMKDVSDLGDLVVPWSVGTRQAMNVSARRNATLLRFPFRYD